MWSNHLLKLLYDIILVPPLRYPDKWKPAFLAMQLGFVAGGFGLIGRDLLFYLTVQNWEPLVLSELFFASFIFLGFILHTIGFAKVGVILSCLAGVGSATAFIFMLGWNSFFHLPGSYTCLQSYLPYLSFFLSWLVSSYHCLQGKDD